MHDDDIYDDDTVSGMSLEIMSYLSMCFAEDVGDIYDDDTVSEMSLEMGEEAGPAFEARAQAQSLAGVGPSVGPGVVAEPQAQNSGLRRFSKDHAVSDDTQKRFMIAVENDEKAAKSRVQDMLVSRHKQTCLQC